MKTCLAFLRQTEAGIPIKLLCRNGGFSDATLDKRRAPFGGMQIAQRLRELDQGSPSVRTPRAPACAALTRPWRSPICVGGLADPLDTAGAGTELANGLSLAPGSGSARHGSRSM
jgi:putative transposase